MDSVRKRSLVDADDTPSITKKRIIADENDIPRATGTPSNDNSDDPLDPARLETFRKQAIYRRMKHYSRESERNRAQLTQLQERNRNSEEAVKALVSCWTQLINTIRSLIPSEAANGQHPNPPALFDMISRHSDAHYLAEIHATVDNSVRATRALVTNFLSSGESPTPSLQQDAFHQCQTKCAELEVSYLDTKRRLDDTSNLLTEREAQLEAAQAHCERLRSTRHSSVSTPVPNGSSTPTIPPEIIPLNGVDSPMADVPQPIADLSALAEREAELIDHNLALRKEVDHLKAKSSQQQTDLMKLHNQFVELPDSRVECSHIYIQAKKAASFYQHIATKVAKEKDDLLKTVKDLTDDKSTYQDVTKAAAAQMDQDYHSKLEKRAAECARLRQERDHARISLRERDLKDATPTPSVGQLEALQKTQSARLDGCRSEVKRLRARLADTTGNPEILRFLLGGYPEDQVSLVEHLQTRIQELEAKVLALQHDGSTLPSDASQLTDLLRQREEDIQLLKLTETQLRQDLSAAETDFITVSSAYDDIEKQVKDKVLNLADRDKTVQESNALRQKSELKWQMAQMEKEAKEQERMAALKEKDAMEQLLNLKDAHVTRLSEEKRQVEALTFELKDCLSKMENLKLEADHKWQVDENFYFQARGQYHDAMNKLTAHGRDLENRDQLALEKETQLEVERKKLERAQKMLEHEKMTQTFKGQKPDKQVELLRTEVEELKSFAKCTSCKKHYRTQVLAGCYHSFCKPCVDGRIAARDRACMTCGLKFGTSDVKNIFF